jgi:hypothetical protein
VMLTRYRGSLALKNWALDIARRSTMRKARVALARRLAVIMFAMLTHRRQRSETETSSQVEHDPREGAKDGADSVARPDQEWPVRFQPSRLAPADPIKRHRARRERCHPKEC